MRRAARRGSQPKVLLAWRDRVKNEAIYDGVMSYRRIMSAASHRRYEACMPFWAEVARQYSEKREAK